MLIKAMRYVINFWHYSTFIFQSHKYFRSSFGGRDSDSEYVKSNRNLLTRLVISTNLARHIRELEIMYEVLVE